MPIVNDLSKLPKAAPAPRPDEPAAIPADENVRFGHLIVDKYLKEKANHTRETSHGTRLRHSDAGKCSRLLSLKGLGLTVTDPTPDEGAGWSFWLGHTIHDAIQAGVEEEYGDRFAVTAENRVMNAGSDASGHTDLTLVGTTDDPDLGRPKVITIEIKTTSRLAYGRAIGDKYDPKGPDTGHLAQLALNAKADDADEAVLILISVTAITDGFRMPGGLTGADLGHRRYVSEWTLTRDQYLPIADRELARMNGILDLLDNDRQIAAAKQPDLPAHAVVIDPAKHLWGIYGTNANGDVGLVDTGNDAWMCGYCPFQPLCEDLDTPGRVDVTAVLNLLPAYQELTLTAPPPTPTSQPNTDRVKESAS